MFTIDDRSYRSPNSSPRPGSVDSILLHTGEGTWQSDVQILCDPRTGDPRNGTPQDRRVSANYYVRRNGVIYRLVDDNWAAWHAGRSSYLGRTDWNSRSIGIETEHREGQTWPAVQVAALAWLCRDLIQHYQIRQEWVAAHRWVAKPAGRKRDPTDWPDDVLRGWITSLYAQRDVWELWGTRYPLDPAARGFGIPTAWAALDGALGEARGPEQYIDDGGYTAVQSFQRGLILWEARPAPGRITVVDRAGDEIL